MVSDLQPMELGDIFDRVFRLFGRTFGRNIILLCIIMIPVGIVMTAGTTYLYSSLGDQLMTLQDHKSMPDEMIAPLMEAAGMLFVCGTLFFIGNIAGKLAVTIVASAEMMHHRIPWGEALEEAMSATFWRTLGQVFIEYLVYISLIICAGCFTVLMSAMLGAFAIILLLPLFALCAVLAIFFAVRWSMTIPILVNEDAKVLESFMRSVELTRRGWWRIFGILLLFMVLTQFAVTLITTPITVLGMLKFTMEYMKMLSTINTNQPDPRVLSEMFHSMGPVLGITTTLSAILTTLIAPLYTTVLYFDLRARAGDFLEPETLPTTPEPPPISL